MDEETKRKKIKELGQRIRKLRKEAGYTNHENFAFDKGLPRAQYGRWERGEDIRFTSLLRLAEAFQIPASELLKSI